MDEAPHEYGEPVRADATRAWPIEVHAPLADVVTALAVGDGASGVDGSDHGTIALELTRVGPSWVGSLPVGSRYRLVAHGPPEAGFEPRRGLVDPLATAVGFPPGHCRDGARPNAAPNVDGAPYAVARPWPAARSPRPTARPLVVYESHVRGLTMRRDTPDAGTFAAMAAELPRLAALGVSVVELLPVHQFDPDESNYWGYMPLVFGAVEDRYAASDDAAAELADLIEAAHRHDIEIWLDVVFNHTTEEDEAGPTYNLRALARDDYYLMADDGAYVNDTGTGNTLDMCSAATQQLVMAALGRFADLGVDGFRFDLATVLSGAPDFVRRIGDWAIERGVRLVAEPWDLARYEVGRAFPDDRWMQWNDRYREDLRGFLRAEPGLVGSVIERLQGSPDLFDEPGRSVNFLTAHDGFTMYDLVSYERKRNLANGWDNRDGTDHNRSWNGDWEGDDGVPAHVMVTRRKQLRNAMTLLMLSNGVPMFVAGDEFGRTQQGNNNAYNQDNEISWVDWARRDHFLALERFVGRLIRFRAEHPVLSAQRWWADDVRWFGVAGPPDLGPESRSIAWHLPGLYVMANMWWEPLRFIIQSDGPWFTTIDTTSEEGFVAAPAEHATYDRIEIGPRSIVVLTSEPAG